MVQPFNKTLQKQDMIEARLNCSLILVELSSIDFIQPFGLREYMYKELVTKIKTMNVIDQILILKNFPLLTQYGLIINDLEILIEGFKEV